MTVSVLLIHVNSAGMFSFLVVVPVVVAIAVVHVAVIAMPSFDQVCNLLPTVLCHIENSAEFLVSPQATMQAGPAH